MVAELRVIQGGRDTAGMVPPCNVELEEDFLGMLLFADSRAEVAKARGLGLRTECFYSDATARIWQGICALADAPDGDVGLRLGLRLGMRLGLRLGMRLGMRL
jgi:hypothetical protein